MNYEKVDMNNKITAIHLTINKGNLTSIEVNL